MIAGAKASSKFIPNSFQYPNAYVDECMHLLTPEEIKVLTYAVRRIFGFNKRQDRISISQFCNGVVSEDGEQLDYGTGLGESTVKRCLANLVRFGLMIRLAENDPGNNIGVLWSLQLDSEKVDQDELQKRKVGIDKLNRKRTKSATVASQQKRGGYVGRTQGTSDVPGDVGRLDGGDVGRAQGGYVGRPTQNPVETQKETQGDMRASERAPLQPSTTREIQSCYERLLGYQVEDWSNGESSAAKAIAQRWTVSQFEQAYLHYKAQPFFKDKRVTLRYLKQQMPELFNGKRVSPINPGLAALQQVREERARGNA